MTARYRMEQRAATAPGDKRCRTVSTHASGEWAGSPAVRFPQPSQKKNPGLATGVSILV
jgi:hypothetical protein